MIRYYLDGIECNPVESEKIRFSLDFTIREFGEIRMSVTNIVFVNKDKEACDVWLSTYGYLVGMPFDVKFEGGLTKRYILDWTASGFSRTENRVKVSAFVRGANDEFFPKADGLTFTQSSPFAPTPLSWTTGDFVNINYLIIPPDLAVQLISISIMTMILAKELIDIIDRTSKGTWKTIEASTPNASVSPCINAGSIITSPLRLAFIIVYTATIIIALLKLIGDLMELIFPQLRQYRGIDYFHLLEKGCAAIGYTFQSSMLAAIGGLTILPVPLRDKNASWLQSTFNANTLAYTNGYPSARDSSCSTLGRALSQLEHIFHAETRVINGVVRLEKQSYWVQNAVDNLELSFNLQENIEEEMTINAQEFYKRKIVLWENDDSDFYTLDDTFDTISEYSTDVGVLPSPDLELTKGYDEVRINFARATQKKSLTVVEKAAKGVASLFDSFTGGNASGLVSDRKKAMIISQQYYNKTKLIIRNGENVADDQSIIGATNIGSYHSDTFVQNISKEVHENMPVRLTEEMFLKINDNNYVLLDGGAVAEIEKVDWNELDRYATVTYTVKKAFPNASTYKLA